jgi:hypothetical protein
MDNFLQNPDEVLDEVSTIAFYDAVLEVSTT